MKLDTERPTLATGLFQILTIVALAVGALFLTTTLTSNETTETDALERFGKTAQSTPDLRPAPDVSVDEGPTYRLERLGFDPSAPSRSNALSDAEPPRLDARNPPQWTEALALPAEHPAAPDPFDRPALEVDPAHRSTAEGLRRSDF